MMRCIVKHNPTIYGIPSLLGYGRTRTHARFTPATVHYGQAASFLRQRQAVLDVAYQLHPERFVHSATTPPQLPSKVWINKPQVVQDITDITLLFLSCRKRSRLRPVLTDYKGRAEARPLIFTADLSSYIANCAFRSQVFTCVELQ